MKFLRLITLCIIFSGLTQNASAIETQKHGAEGWDATLLLPENKSVRFQWFMYEKENKIHSWIQNGVEKIDMLPSTWIGDSLFVEHPVFDSYLMIYRKNGEMNGYWKDRSRKGNYTIPLNFKRAIETIYNADHSQETRWACQFDTGIQAYPAIGVFHRSNQNLTGTFLTETGDYRFLVGAIFNNDSFYLSCFDGSHAFLFEGKWTGDNITGMFYSGLHWKTTWRATKDDKAQLKNGFELTKANNTGIIKELILRDSLGFSLEEEPYKNKPLILQISGTWCPNCMDETRYITSLLQKQKAMPEVIAFYFERGDDELLQQAKIDRVKANMQVPYSMLLAGKASTKSASAVFPFLDGIMSFPTTVFLNRNHQVIGVHTGFNGPATGDAFAVQSAEMLKIINQMMLE